MLVLIAVRAVCRKPSPSSIPQPFRLDIRSLSYRMASTLPNLPIFQAITKHKPTSTAIIHSDSNQAFSYGTLLRDVVAAKKQISQIVPESRICGERIAFLAENNYNYVGTSRLHTERAILNCPSNFPCHPR